MVTRSQKIRLGIFIFSAVVVFVALVVSLSVNRLFKEKDIYHIAYENISVSGLEVGSAVKYLGIRVGSIQEIKIDPENISRVIVSIGVEKGTPIKKDVRADISTIGITGIKIIELSGGSQDAPLLKPGGFIKPGTSLTEEITGKAEVLANKIELILNNLLAITAEENQKAFADLLQNSNRSMTQLNSLLQENRTNVAKTVANLDSVSLTLLAATRSANRSLTAMERVIHSDTIDVTINNIARIVKKVNDANIYQLIERLRASTEEANKMLNQLNNLIRGNRLKFHQTVNDLNQTVQSLKDAARQIDENPSILIRGQNPKNPPDEQLEH